LVYSAALQRIRDETILIVSRRTARRSLSDRLNDCRQLRDRRGEIVSFRQVGARDRRRNPQIAASLRRRDDGRAAGLLESVNLGGYATVGTIGTSRT
jgi:hypothetical protein